MHRIATLALSLAAALAMTPAARAQAPGSQGNEASREPPEARERARHDEVVARRSADEPLVAEQPEPQARFGARAADAGRRLRSEQLDAAQVLGVDESVLGGAD